MKYLCAVFMFLIKKHKLISYSDYKVISTMNFQWDDLLTTKQVNEIRAKFNNAVNKILRTI